MHPEGKMSRRSVPTQRRGWNGWPSRSQARLRTTAERRPTSHRYSPSMGILALTLGYALGLGHAALAVYLVVGGW